MKLASPISFFFFFSLIDRCPEYEKMGSRIKSVREVLGKRERLMLCLRIEYEEGRSRG